MLSPARSRKPTRAQRRQAVTTATHVLHWTPAWMAPGSKGFWKLQGFEAYITGVPAAPSELAPLPRIVGDDALAGWAAAQLGCPVVLTYTEIVLGRASGQRRRERCPLYWVTPVHLLEAAGGWR